MVTNKQTTPKRTRRAASKPTPVIDPSVKPDVADFDPAVHTTWRLVNVAGTPTVMRKHAEKPMDLPTGITQPTDAAGNVVRTTPVVTKSNDLLLASTVELLTRFPEAQKSWVVALRTARWARQSGITRTDGTQFLSCDNKRFRGLTPGSIPFFEDALAIVVAAPKKRTPAKSAAKPKRAAAKSA
jgi:hypothetical protein